MVSSKIPKVLSIAGSDPSGGAGIQGDIKTIFAEGCYGMAAITGMTAQNTLGVKAVIAVPDDFLRMQLDAVICDIIPDAVKIGMISEPSHVKIIVDMIDKYKLRNVITDPVIAPTSGVRFAHDEVLVNMIDYLFPASTLVTPNIPEAQTIVRAILDKRSRAAGEPVSAHKGELPASELTPSEMAELIGCHCDCSVLVKGGHSADGEATDCMWHKGELSIFRGRRIAAMSSHGTGCALSSSIASNLAKGESLAAAVQIAKAHVTAAIAGNMSIGSGNGSIDHEAILQQQRIQQDTINILERKPEERQK